MDLFLNKVPVSIPEGYFDIPDDCIVKEGDQVAAVSFGREEPENNKVFGKLVGKISWLKVDAAEIGKIKKYTGKIVIRKI
jgi:hypothetical protein